MWGARSVAKFFALSIIIKDPIPFSTTNTVRSITRVNRMALSAYRNVMRAASVAFKGIDRPLPPTMLETTVHLVSDF